MKQTRGEDATMESELSKEAPADYILSILQTVFPHNLRIENNRDKHISGCDWKIHWKPSPIITEIDDKNDLYLGLTGNISLDEITTEKQDVIQLFVNYPTFKGKYLFIYNNLIRNIDLHQWIHERMQTWGKTTKCFIVPISKIEDSHYKEHPELANPNLEWFTRKRNL